MSAADYRALRENAAAIDLPDWTVLRLRGPDARAFLQGMATQDLTPLRRDRAALTFFLTEKGRPVALAWVASSIDRGAPAGGAPAEAIHVIADEGARDTLRAHFERFRVMEDVEFEGPEGMPRLVGVAGPAGSQEVQAFGASMTRSGIAYVSMSATRDDLTNGQRPTFFRVVGSDDIQGAVDARYAVRTLKADKLVVINDGSSYSVGVAARFANVAHILGADVDLDEITQQQTDFSPLVDKIGNDVDLVFLAFQIASQGQTFAQQMRAKGKSAIIFGPDGMFSSDFTFEGAYVSAFARDIHGVKGTAALIKAYEKKYGKFGTFGPPTYVAVQVVLAAIDKACQAGAATRKAVLAQIKKTNLKNTILGQGIRFDANGDVLGGVFYIYRIVNGKYQLVFPK